MTENSEETNELSWQAFRYSLGEMSEAEQLDFEARLADDQTAREQLAQAVELTQVIRASRAVEEGEIRLASLDSARNPWSQPLLWFGVSSAALLAIMFTFTYLTNPDVPRDQVSLEQLPADELDALATAWSAAALAEVAPDGESTEVVDFDDAELAASVEEADSSQRLEAPSWMIAAARTELDLAAPEDEL